jgi:dolichol-phosphate mannosyltransferase
VYNEELVIGELRTRLAELLGKLDVSWEVIFVNDGSRDRSLEMLKELAATDERYRVVSFSRNFGHQFAITAGLDYARGDAVVVMDADLQDPPEVILEMLAKWRAGFDIVHAISGRREREGIFKRLTAFLFYRLLRSIVGVPIPVDAGDFRLMARRVVLTLRALHEVNRFVRGMVAWVGFRQTSVTYVRHARFAGETHYPLRKMLRFALDGITSFSTLPLRIATWLGVLSGLFALLVAGWALYEKLHAHTVQGWTTLMIVVALGASAQLMMTGILGGYVGRMYEEIKKRPLYIVAEEVNAARDEA